MEILSYMLRIDRVIRILDKITPDMFDMLSLFTFNQYLSIYQIHKIWKDNVKKIAYKNIHIKIQKLIEFNLIERETNDSKFKERELERGAKYYILSEEGIFALLYYNSISTLSYHIYENQSFKNGKTKEDKAEIFNEYEKEIFKNHPNCDLFKLFLYPWISLDTIKKLSASGDLIDKIRISLNARCNLIKRQLLRFPGGMNFSYFHGSQFKFNSNPEEKDIEITLLHYKAVFSLIMGKIRDDDLALFKNDEKFMDTLNILKKSFDIKYNSLLDNN